MNIIDNPYIILVTIVFFLATIATFATRDVKPYVIALYFAVISGFGYFLYLI